MQRLPQAIIIVDSTKEYNAIREARKLKIPVFGIIDTNCDPDMVDYVIPGNDDAVRSIKVVLGALTNAIVEANGGTLVDYVTEDENKKAKFDKSESKKTKEVKKETKKEEKKENKEVKETKEEPKKEETVNKEVETKIDLEILTVSELRELAKKKEIKGYSKMKKDELIASLK